MNIKDAIKTMIDWGLDETLIKHIIRTISINELDIIKDQLWEKAETAKFALEADTYLQVISMIKERKENHETNK